MRIKQSLYVLSFVLLYSLFLSINVNGEGELDYDKDGAFFSSIRDQSPILIPPCNSPRAALSSFYDLTENIKNVFEGSTELGEIQWKQEKQLIVLYSQLRFMVDYGDISAKEHFAQANVLSSQLSDVLDRIPVPPLDAIPDYAEVVRDKLNFWRIPNTEIALILISKGPRRGDWVFSSKTMHNIGRFYKETKYLPVLSNIDKSKAKSYIGLLDHYMSFTGTIIPMHFTESLPKWMLTKFFEVPLWKFFGTLILIFFLMLFGLLIHRITRFRGDIDMNQNNIKLNVRRVLLPLVLVIVIPFVISFITEELRIRLIPLEVIDDILWVIFFMATFWLSITIGSLISILIIRLPSFPRANFDASLVKIICRLIAVFIGGWILFEGLGELGVSMVPLVAGASVGGLAFALAVKPTLSNIISGMLIYADKPFAIGQRISIKGFIGNVEAIGLRSTKIRTLEGHVVSIPNDEVCNTDLENISKRPSIKRKFSVTITYDTSPKKIKLAMDIIRQLLSVDEDNGKSEEELGHPPSSCVNQDPKNPPRVFFDELNADSLNLLVIYYFAPPNYYNSLEFATWFNSELIERFNKAKIDFAFPTQTIEYKPVK